MGPSIRFAVRDKTNLAGREKMLVTPGHEHVFFFAARCQARLLVNESRWPKE